MLFEKLSSTSVFSKSIFSGKSIFKSRVSKALTFHDFIILLIKTGDSLNFITFSILSLFSALSQSAVILYAISSLFLSAFIVQEISLLVHAGIMIFLIFSATAIFVSNSTLNQISSHVLLNIIAQITETSQSLNISGVLSSTITFFLTSIKLSE